MDLLDNKRFLVFGLGKSGISIARLLAGKGYEVVLSDDDESVVHAAQDNPVFAGLPGHVGAVVAEKASAALTGCGCVVVSPGVPLDHALVANARESGVEVTGELEIASRFCRAPIIGVTGTNGKSTVVSVIGSIFKAAGIRAVVAGNIGTPFSAVVENDDSWDVVVLEISSFQLDTISRFKTRVAALLNITTDHLDRYNDSFDEYKRSKARILLNTDFDTVFVYNADDPSCREIADGFTGVTIPFSSSRVLDTGVYAKSGNIVRSLGDSIERVMVIDEFPPVGIHNLENAMASVAAVTPFGVDAANIEAALAAYRPLPHRMEPVRTVGSVEYINDSKATNVDATIKSLRSIGGAVILIMGGLDKNGDFELLKGHLTQVKLVVLIGDATEKIKSVLEGSCALAEATTMEDAVRMSSDASDAGDTVLLAPACASFDMFENYAKRGEAFRAAVNALED
ncbi:MAG: UDP-N-acetylmuramoyl-L-alanine--D-glutamate ligase [Candidatus Latescibacterota bacterium]|nr:MAG: UDP-N-acetylmuramoyl-L-alanine--D-glutamate ligase [Candidatus Latescibacterota bacterium]